MSKTEMRRSDAAIVRRISRSLLMIISSLPFFVGIFGCGSTDNGRVPVRGDVTYKGEPVAYGSISLRPAKGVTGVAAGTSINDGKFDIPQKNGPSTGKYVARFTITGEIQDNQQRLGGRMTTIEVPVEILSGDEEYNFELPIEPKP